MTRALQLGLNANQSLEYELCIEPAGYNANKDDVIAKVQELLIKHQVDIIMAPLNVGLLAYIKHYFSGEQVVLIVNTLGEDVVFHETQDPFVFINSFNLWQSSWLSGYWSAIEYGPQACSIAAYHDAGYGMLLSFALGLEAHEGKLNQVQVTHQQTRDQDPSADIQAVINTNPDFVMGFYSGREAISFLQTWRQLEGKTHPPLVTLPFAVDEILQAQLGDLAIGVTSISCWNRETLEAKHFLEIYQAQTQYPVNCYALLAYETGHLIASAMRHIGTSQALQANLAEALKFAEFNGPRGLLKFDTTTRETTIANYYVHKVQKGADNQLHNKVINALEIPPLLDEQLNLSRKNLEKQGWLNPYLIA